MFNPKLSLGIPGPGNTLATSPIPGLVFDKWEQLPVRNQMSQVTVPRYSQYGTPQIEGPDYNTKYIWSATYKATESVVRQLESLYEYQQQSRVPLRLIDEVEYLASEPNPHSRTLLVAISESWNVDYVYGYGVFNVWLTLSNDWRKHFGTAGTGDNLKEITFSMVEM